MSGDGPASALMRLRLSRDRLRLALGGAEEAQGGARVSTSPGKAAPDPHSAPPQPRAPASGWLDSLLAIPLAQVLVDAVSGWWVRHPLRPAVVLASAVLTVTIRPLARRHPLALVAGALVAGGLIAWIRPWRPLRWAARPTLFAGLGPHLLSKALAEVPLQAWLTAWTETAQARQPGATPAPPRGDGAAAFQSSSAGS
jgi:hypothetical protein